MNKKGRKPMMVIFGAMIVFRQANSLHAEIVKGQRELPWWPVKSGPRGHVQGKSPGRAFIEDEDWQYLPESVRNAGITADLYDYHGNFTAELLESIFENLC